MSDTSALNNAKMVELNNEDNQPAIVSDTNEESERPEDQTSEDKDVDIVYTTLWNEVKDAKSYFNMKDFLLGCILGLCPSAWDIGTDFEFAEKQENREIANASLFFISLPGIVTALTFLHQLLVKCCGSGKCGAFVRGLVSFCLVGGVVNGLVFLVGGRSSYPMIFSMISYPMAICVATAILLIKAVAIFVHSPEMKKLAVKTTAYEGSYESSAQACIILAVWLYGLGPLDASAMCSSLLMVSKGGVENFLTFGTVNKMENRALVSKLRLLAKFIPVFLLTACFRLGTLTAVCVCSSFGFVILLPLALGLPFCLLMILKIFNKLHNLSVMEIAQGILGELLTIVLWGGLGREGSRKLQLFMCSYLLVLYSTLFCFLIYDPSGSIFPVLVDDPSGPIWPDYMQSDPVPRSFTVSLMFCGLLSFILFIYQIFYFDQYKVDVRKKMYNLANLLPSA